MSSGHGSEEKTSMGEKLLLLAIAIVVMFLISIIVGAIASPFNMAAPGGHGDTEGIHHESDEDPHEEAVEGEAQRIVIPQTGRAEAGDPVDLTKPPDEAGGN
jgi:hypothetical protein